MVTLTAPHDRCEIGLTSMSQVLFCKLTIPLRIPRVIVSSADIAHCAKRRRRAAAAYPWSHAQEKARATRAPLQPLSVRLPAWACSSTLTGTRYLKAGIRYFRTDRVMLCRDACCADAFMTATPP
jgi:hypothetical protein